MSAKCVLLIQHFKQNLPTANSHNEYTHSMSAIFCSKTIRTFVGKSTEQKTQATISSLQFQNKSSAQCCIQ